MQIYANICKYLNKSLYPIISLLSHMSEKYKVGITTKLNRPAHAQRGTPGSQMNKVTDTLLDVTKVAVVSGAAIGVMGAAGALLKK